MPEMATRCTTSAQPKGRPTGTVQNIYKTKHDYLMHNVSSAERPAKWHRIQSTLANKHTDPAWQGIVPMACRTQSIHFKWLKLNSIQFISSQFKPIQLYTTQINSCRFHLIQFNSSQLISGQFNSSQLNSIQVNSTRINLLLRILIEFNSIEFTPSQFISIHINSFHFKSQQ